MEILIHTYGRHDRQITWKNLSPSIQADTKLVVQDREKHLYPNYPTIVLPPHLTKLAETRQWIFSEYAQSEYICILDDDLEFAVRRDDDRTKFRKPTAADVDLLFEKIMWGLENQTPLVGVAPREGGNRNTEYFLMATRQMRMHAIDVKLYRKLGIRFDRVEVMEDFDVTLQFLEAGYSNLVLNDWVTNQHGSNTDGGCSHYRTPEVQKESAEKLRSLHPNFVKVVKKQTKTSWGGQERYDVIVQWKRALRSSETLPVLDPGKGTGP